MSEKEIGKLKTFPQLLEEENTIIIPKVQRDYAYGREDEKVAEILDGMLTSILEAVRDNKVNILDFVYGGSYVKKNNNVGGLIPLDGQQRLTTLFLLYFYASLLESPGEGFPDRKEVGRLAKFRYETRQSATEFCSNLVSGIRDHLLKRYDAKEGPIQERIKDDPLYLSTYDNDPTIISMLNVLDKIEKKCMEMDMTNLSPSLWRRLMDSDNNQFYTLSLENFGLNDDLFIKMNARGKKLTEFEIFKSDMMSAIHAVSDSLKDEFSKKMDTEWIDIVWDYTDKTINERRRELDITNDADKKYSNLFQNIFRLEFYRRNLPASGYSEADIPTILSDSDSIENVIEIFDTLYSIHKNEGFDGFWSKYFYFSDDVVGRDGLIRLFWKQKRMSVFELALNGMLTVPETVYLYSLYLIHKAGYDELTAKRCLRIIHNLMTGSARAADARYDKLPGFLKEVKYVIDNKGIPVYYDKELTIDGQNHKLAFISNVWNEEYVKQNFLSPADYDSLIRYENHDILQCSLSLFLDYTLDGITSKEIAPEEPVEASWLITLLKKFESLFDNGYNENFRRISNLFLDKDINYMQYDPNMDRYVTKRYFLTESKHLSDFFIKGNARREQENILKILEQKELPADYSLSDESYKSFTIKDWKYYRAKYRDYCFLEYTNYGMGVWEDLGAYPLDLILLRSSYHSENNLEWKMMTHILWKLLGDNDIYQLDDHGCSPIHLTKEGSAIGFEKGKWRIETSRAICPKIKEDHPDWNVTEDESRQLITVDFGEDNEGMDYIDMGRYLVNVIENSGE